MLPQFVLKLNRACNLRCTYCYYVNEETENYGSRMKLATILAFLDKYASYCQRHGIQGSLVFHGGEPLLMGMRYMTAVLSHPGFRDGTFFPILQTNATLLTDEWIDLLLLHKVEIGVSLDGPPEVHDRERKTARGKGSYNQVLRGIQLLQDRGVSVGVLAVIDPRGNGEEVFEHFIDLGIKHMDFLLPIHHYEAEMYHKIDHQGIENYLVSAFLAWYKRNDPSIQVRLFWNLMLRMLGKRDGYFPIGVARWDEFAVLETDGTVARLEDLAEVEKFSVNKKYYNTGMNFEDHSFEDIDLAMHEFWSKYATAGLPTPCHMCDVKHVCRGGNFATRFSGDDNFDNPGIHCSSLKKLSRLIVGLHDLHSKYVEKDSVHKNLA